MTDDNPYQRYLHWSRNDLRRGWRRPINWRRLFGRTRKGKTLLKPYDEKWHERGRALQRISPNINRMKKYRGAGRNNRLRIMVCNALQTNIGVNVP